MLVIADNNAIFVYPIRKFHTVGRFVGFYLDTLFVFISAVCKAVGKLTVDDSDTVIRAVGYTVNVVIELILRRRTVVEHIVKQILLVGRQTALFKHRMYVFQYTKLDDVAVIRHAVDFHASTRKNIFRHLFRRQAVRIEDVARLTLYRCRACVRFGVLFRADNVLLLQLVPEKHFYFVRFSVKALVRYRIQYVNRIRIRYVVGFHRKGGGARYVVCFCARVVGQKAYAKNCAKKH